MQAPSAASTRQISHVKIKQRLRWSKLQTELRVAEETQNKDTHNLLCRQRKRFDKRRNFLNASTANSNGMLVFSDSMFKEQNEQKCTK